MLCYSRYHARHLFSFRAFIYLVTLEFNILTEFFHLFVFCLYSLFYYPFVYFSNSIVSCKCYFCNLRLQSIKYTTHITFTYLKLTIVIYIVLVTKISRLDYCHIHRTISYFAIGISLIVTFQSQSGYCEYPVVHVILHRTVAM